MVYVVCVQQCICTANFINIPAHSGIFSNGIADKLATEVAYKITFYFTLHWNYIII